MLSVTLLVYLCSAYNYITRYFLSTNSDLSVVLTKTKLMIFLITHGRDDLKKRLRLLSVLRWWFCCCQIVVYCCSNSGFIGPVKQIFSA